MCNKERIISLLDVIPPYKMRYVLAYVQGIAAGEEADDQFFRKTKLSYPVCIYPNDTEPGFTAIVPDLPGCVTCGRTIQDAIEMAVDAASGWVLDELEHGNLAPKASDIRDITPDEYPGGFTSMLILDMDAYAKTHGASGVHNS